MRYFGRIASQHPVCRSSSSPVARRLVDDFGSDCDEWTFRARMVRAGVLSSPDVGGGPARLGRADGSTPSAARPRSSAERDFSLNRF